MPAAEWSLSVGNGGDAGAIQEYGACGPPCAAP